MTLANSTKKIIIKKQRSFILTAVQLVKLTLTLHRPKTRTKH